jgi:glycerophosphoryl diester phosphodiesterase
MDAVNPHSSHLGDTATEVMGEINEAQLRAVVWGVNTASEVTMMANAGVAAIITDDPGMAREVIDHL